MNSDKGGRANWLESTGQIEQSTLAATNQSPTTEAETPRRAQGGCGSATDDRRRRGRSDVDSTEGEGEGTDRRRCFDSTEGEGASDGDGAGLRRGDAGEVRVVDPAARLLDEPPPVAVGLL